MAGRPQNPNATVQEIFRRMNQLKLNPSSLAARAGLNESYFRDLFRGKSQNPLLAHLPAIAKALQCEEANLRNPGASDDEPDIENREQEIEEILLLTVWRRLSRAGKARVLRALRDEEARSRPD
jgi:transcriptional regulator with XRE-family HTH domain